jgi:2-polyprenyl-6-methoxyphenol hydroxylase-like FAD-dependent oxidoreductase
MVDENVPVLIVGGSLVGLSTAVFLGHHGVSSLVLERHRGTAIHPRAALVSQRTVETYGTVGLQARSPVPSPALSLETEREAWL